MVRAGEALEQQVSLDQNVSSLDSRQNFGDSLDARKAA
jgi:hypothetical protein